MNDDREPPRRLTSLPTELVEEGYKPPGDYRVIREKAVNREIPGAHQRNGIWHYWPQDIPAIAAALRLKKSSEHEPLAHRTSARRQTVAVGNGVST